MQHWMVLSPGHIDRLAFLSLSTCALKAVGEVVSIGTASVGLEQVAAMADDVCVGTDDDHGLNFHTSF